MSKTRSTIMESLQKLCMLLIICLTLIFNPFSVSGQTVKNNQGSGTSEDPYIVPTTESEIKVDAVLDEPAWQKALVLELNYEVRPGENVTPPVRTEVLLIYDSRNLYAAFRCYDPDPSAIRAHLRDRDTLGGDDWVGLIFDTFNDQRRSLDYLVTAQGVQFDEIESQSGEDPGWDAIWESAGRITDWGYSVEIAIPFSSIRFQRTTTPQVWGFDAQRRYPRDHGYHIGLFSRDRSNNCYLCQAVKIKGFQGVSPGHNIEIDPTLTAIRSDYRPDFPEGKLARQNYEEEFGVSAQWGITPNMTLNGTINPDFSQVEADALQMDINEPFALFYPERRPFFTEGTDFFAALENIIYTRTLRNPSWGLKLTGKEGANTVGAYMVRDDITNLIFPGSQNSNSTSLNMNNTSSVFRYKRDFGSRYTVGLLGTDREAKDYYNRVYGFDLDFRFTPTNQIQLLVLGSSTKYPEEVTGDFNQPAGSFKDRLISFEYDHYTRTWGWWADYEEAGSGFRADLGYYPRVGYRNIEGGLLYTWNAKPNSWWAYFRLGGDLHYFEESNGKLLSETASLWLNYNGIMQSFVYLEAEQAREAYANKEFNQTAFVFQCGFWPAGNLELGATTMFGDQIDFANIRLGNRFRINPWLSYNLGKHLRLSLNHNYENMNVQNKRLYTANISQLTAVYQFTVRMYLRSILQYVNYDYNPGNYTFDVDSEFNRFFAQLLFSYKINPRTVLFLGYSDNYLGDQNIRLTQSNRTLFLKLGYAWVL